MYAAWIGFAGAFLGGALTLVGVLITIKYYKKQDKHQSDKSELSKIKALYWFFKIKCDLICEWSKNCAQYESSENAYWCPEEQIYDESYFLYYVESLQSITSALTSEEIHKLSELLKEMQRLETRRVCFMNQFDDLNVKIELDCKNDTQYKKAIEDYKGFESQLNLVKTQQEELDGVLNKMKDCIQDS